MWDESNGDYEFITVLILLSNFFTFYLRIWLFLFFSAFLICPTSLFVFSTSLIKMRPPFHLAILSQLLSFLTVLLLLVFRNFFFFCHTRFMVINIQNFTRLFVQAFFFSLSLFYFHLFSRHFKHCQTSFFFKKKNASF